MQLLRTLILAAVVVAFAAPVHAQEKKRILFLTKSSGFEHSVIKRTANDPPAHAERILIELGAKNGFEVVCTKDASLFNDPKTYEQYDVFAFYTTGSLLQESKDGGKAMTREGHDLFLKAVENGKGVIGFHCATDTFHSPKPPTEELLKDSKEQPKYNVTPFLSMMGGEFAGHGDQQKATMLVVSRALPGTESLTDFTLHEEWYNLINFAPDLHVILVNDTASMSGDKNKPSQRMYFRPNFPSTWARMHGRGRVFYTAMGHREDVWENPIFQQLTLAAMNWTSGKTNAAVPANIDQVTPKYKQIKQ
jgi:hypothetical protein